MWVRQRCWEEPVLGRTDRPEVSGASCCLHLYFLQLSRLWKTFANKHPSPKLTSWQRGGKTPEKNHVAVRASWRREEREEIRPRCSLLKTLIFLTAVLQTSFFRTCLQNVAFFKVNRCLQKLLKYCRSSFGTWFHISSAIWNPGVYLNLKLKFRSLVWGRDLLMEVEIQEWDRISPERLLPATEGQWYCGVFDKWEILKKKSQY